MSGFLAVIFSVLTVFAPTYFAFVVLRFLTAATGSGLAATGFVLCMEITGREYRSLVGFGAQVPFTLGAMVLALEAYAIRDWRMLMLFVSTPALFVVSYLWIFPGWCHHAHAHRKSLRHFISTNRESTLVTNARQVRRGVQGYQLGGTLE